MRKILLSVLIILGLCVPAWATDYTQDADCLFAANFDEASGNVIDQCGSNDGTVTGATQNQTGKFGKAVSFDGDNDKISFGDVTFLDGLSTFTICWYMKQSSQAGTTSIIRKDGSWTPLQTNADGTLWSGACNSTDQPSYDDLTTWNQVDPANYQTVTNVQTTSLGTRMPGDVTSYLNKDSGNGYWTTFQQSLDVKTENYVGYGQVNLVPWSISNSSAATYAGLTSAGEGIGLIMDMPNRVTLYNFATDESDFTTASRALYWGTWTYYTIQRTDSAITCRIYTDAERTSLLDTLTIPYDSTAFRYVTINASDGSVASSNYHTLAVANVDIGESTGEIDPPAPDGPTFILGGGEFSGLNQ